MTSQESNQTGFQMFPPIFAHLHSSPLVVRRCAGTSWRNQSAPAGIDEKVSGLEAVEIIDVKAERRLLLETLRESGRRVVWHSEVADLHAFQRVLSFGCRALHFSGHGVPGKVIFETHKGEAQFVSQQELQDLLLASGAGSCRHSRCKHDERTLEGSYHSQCLTKCDQCSNFCRSPSSKSNSEDATSGLALGNPTVETDWVDISTPLSIQKPTNSLQLVFVSACHSESVAHAFVRAGVPHVVVVSKEEKVLDRKAMEFAKAFYTALFAGLSVAKSFQIGRVQAEIAVVSEVYMEKPSEFKLLGHGDHANALFQDVPIGHCVEMETRGMVREKRVINDCDAVAETFVGRSLEVYQVYKSLVEGARLVSITGECGIGKTEVALQCAQYATERRVFRHIFYLRLSTDNEVEDNVCEVDSCALIDRFAKCLDLVATSLDELVQRARQRCEEESRGDGSTFLLILDGWDQVQRQKASLYTIVTMLLRRVISLSILLTGEGRFLAMDGVSEKVVPVGSLPPRDAALLFTLRAPRKIKVHEMGGGTDLETFGNHPIIKRLRGHPRNICAISHFLESKDLELDRHEFLNNIIPSVTGVGSHTESSTDCEVPLRRFGWKAPALLETNVAEDCHLYPSEQRDLLSLGVEKAEFQPQPSACETAICSVKPAASQSNRETSPSSLTLLPTKSDSILSDLNVSPKTLHKQLCLLKVVKYVRPIIKSEGGSLVWARAVIINATFSGLPNAKEDFANDKTAATIRQLQDISDIPLKWIAPQMSCFFAIKLKGDAIKRPLSNRSIDFLSHSSSIWGCDSAAPAQRGGAVSLRMFTAFWTWFWPLVECILRSNLWPHTEPRLLHGFLSKTACARMLEHAPPGTFLLRFSETRLRCIVIVYVHEDQYVRFVPVEWQPDCSGWFIALESDTTAGDMENNGITFRTLHELIRSVSVLKFLFPHIPKETAFTM